jgi:hypothetical protein
MKTSFRSSTILFAGVQLIGLVCMCTWQSTPLAVASLIWGTALIALFPGNFLSTMLIEKLFWKSELSLTAMLAAEIPVLIAINAALWFALIKTMRRLFRPRFH